MEKRIDWWYRIYVYLLYIGTISSLACVIGFENNIQQELLIFLACALFGIAVGICVLHGWITEAEKNTVEQTETQQAYVSPGMILLVFAWGLLLLVSYSVSVWIVELLFLVNGFSATLLHWFEGVYVLVFVVHMVTAFLLLVWIFGTAYRLGVYWYGQSFVRADTPELLDDHLL